MIINNPTPISKIPVNASFTRLFEDIQGNILKAHGRTNVQLLFLNFGADPKPVIAWIKKDILPRVTSFAQQLDTTTKFKTIRDFPDPGFCSFSISKKGYGALRIEDGLTDNSFKKGLGNGTVQQDPPKQQWEESYKNEIHALIILGNANEGGVNDLDKMVQSIKASLPATVRVVAEENGKGLPDEKEHFGFADGISQPRFFTEDLDKESATNWDPFASLDLALVRDPLGRAFIGGFTGAGDIPANDDDSGQHSYGSFLVYRKLEQDVAGWNAAVVKGAAQIGIAPHLFAAYAVGRFQDGTPVVNHGAPAPTVPFENDFNYSGDQNGLKCPFHAHIRKSNPRGDSVKLGATLEEEKQHRISRRGIPYTINERERGLLFMCYQSSIVNQFEFMQNAWVDNPNFVNPNTGEDSTIGQGTTTNKDWPVNHGGPTTKKTTFAHFVTLRGGEYFFTPSISALRNLSPANQPAI
jgi:Dyp-type peroxidase family